MKITPTWLTFTIPAPILSVLCGAIVLFTVSLSDAADEQTNATTSESSPKSAKDSKHSDVHASARVPLSVARDRAMLMHQIYATTLEVMHDRYFHADRSVVPARAMEDVFESLERQTGSQAKWISVNLRAMSINHDPETDFEKQAARELGRGQAEYTLVEDGVYRRATPIPLHGGCVSCHAGFNPKPSKTPKMAGLIISMPVIADETSQP